MLDMSTARQGRLTPLAAVDGAGRKRPIVPLRRAGESDEEVVGVPGALPEQKLLNREDRAVGRPGSAQPPSGASRSVVAAVEHFLTQADAERRRLQTEIDAAQAHLSSLNEKLQLKRKQVEADLGALALNAQDEVAALERAHEERVRQIREAARTEAQGLVGAARAHAQSMEQSAIELARILTQPHPTGHSAAPSRART
ncbi:MAG: hypothetical protein NVS3B21_13480 [Acidimicrobiales bacterium]